MTSIQNLGAFRKERPRVRDHNCIPRKGDLHMGSLEEFGGVVQTFIPALEDLFSTLGGGSLTPGTGSDADK